MLIIKIIKKESSAKWVILAVCFLMEFLCLGFCSSTGGLYLVPVTEALDIQRSLYSITTSIRYIVQVFVAFYFGSLVRKFGIKKLVLAGLSALFGSMLIRAYATNIIHIYIAGALLGLGVVLSGGTMAGTIIRRWFDQDVGKYTGIVMSANGIGGAIAVQIISPIINTGEKFAYQNGYKLSALIVLLFSIVIIMFLKDPPSAPNYIPVKGKKKPRGMLWQGLEFTEVKRKPYFYLAVIMVFTTGISLQSISGITIAHMTDVGLSARAVAAMATISSMILTVSKFFVGYLYDKRGLRITFVICHIATVLAFALKAILTDSTLGIVIAVIATALTSLALPLETVMLPLIANDLFGTASYDKVLGILMAMNSLGLCLGSPLGNIYYDLFGTYVPCFWLFVILMVIVTVGWQLTLTRASRDKETILNCQENE